MTRLSIIATLLVFTSAMAAQSVGTGTRGQTTRPLSSLPVTAQARISATIGEDSPDYAVRFQNNEGLALNPIQKFETRFSSQGAEVRTGGMAVNFKANGLGYGDDLVALPAAVPHIERNRVDYRRGAMLEWYVNGPVGLEQGFTIERAPTRAQGQALTIAVAVSGDLSSVADKRRTGMSLVDRSGQVHLSYQGVSATDADGKDLPAWIEVHKSNLLLRVHDAGAHYPVVVDPWVQLAELTSSNGVAGDEFGIAVAVNGNAVVVGASQFNSTHVGAAYVFVKGSNGWSNMTQTAKLRASDGAAGDLFGSSVAFAGPNTIVVGAPHASVGTHQMQGKAYVFVEPTNGWANMSQTARLTAKGGAGGDLFGYSVSGSGAIVAIGAPQHSGQVAFQGAVYLFVKPVTGWTTTSAFKAELTASNAAFDDGFGVSVSLNGGTLVAGIGQANSGKGAAYVFVRPTNGWQTTSNFNAELTASDGKSGDAFGGSVAISNNTIVAGAYLATVVNQYQGAAYVFVEPVSGWASMTETAKLTASDSVGGDEFGYSVAISGGMVVAGASNAPSTNAAYIYLKPATGWATTSKFNAKLTASDASIFGFSVATNGSTIVAGAIGNQSLQGAAYVFGH
jgi:hypothetical protein